MNDSGDSLNFLMLATLEPGTTYVRVGAFSSDTGVYTLHVERVDRVEGVAEYRPLKGWIVSPGACAVPPTRHQLEPSGWLRKLASHDQ